MISALMTADEFAASRHTLPEGGRWHELHSGRLHLLSTPEEDHGTVVFNLSRALADWFRGREEADSGYAAFDIGLRVKTGPDTVLFPSMSFFDQGTRFGQSDLLIATLRPRLVVDIASTADRRQLMRERTLMYLKHGIQIVWIPDPFKREIQVLQRGRHTLVLGERQTLSGGEVLPDFAVPVADVFTEPSWWSESI